MYTHLTLNELEYDYFHILHRKLKSSTIRNIIPLINDLLTKSWLSVFSQICIKSVDTNIARRKKQRNEQVSEKVQNFKSTSLKIISFTLRYSLPLKLVLVYIIISLLVFSISHLIENRCFI